MDGATRVNCSAFGQNIADQIGYRPDAQGLIRLSKSSTFFFFNRVFQKNLLFPLDTPLRIGIFLENLGFRICR